MADQAPFFSSSDFPVTYDEHDTRVDTIRKYKPNGDEKNISKNLSSTRLKMLEL